MIRQQGLLNTLFAVLGDCSIPTKGTVVSSSLVESDGSQTTPAALTDKQQRKQDALDLAEVIYDIFQDSMSSANIEEKSIKEKDYA